MVAPRILLLEFLSTARFYQLRSESFPFVHAYVRARGLAVRWLAFGYRPDPTPATRFVMRLPPDEERALAAAVADFQPTHVLANQLLAAPLRAALLGAAPSARFATCELEGGPLPDRRGDVARWLDLADERPEAWLADEFEADHSCELANALAREIRPFVRVLGGPTCYYRAPLAHNPAFRGVALPPEQRLAGCSFCSEQRALRYPYATPPAALALRQIRAARATCPPARWSGEFVLLGSAAFLRVRALFEALLAEGGPPATFYFYCRIDELLRRAGDLDALWPRLTAAGHVVSLFAMGVENFSPAENERFHKGLALADIERALALLTRWEREWPNTLRFRAHGGFSFILFTPWTTPGDLRFNLECARRYGLPPTPQFFASRLQLFEGRAVLLLARRDGVLVPAFEDPVFAAYDSGCVTAPGQVERPWRFLSPGVAALYGLCVRLWPWPAAPADDPLSARVQALVARLREGEAALFRLLEAALEVLCDPAPALSTAALLDRLEPRAAALELLVAPRDTSAARRRAALRLRTAQRLARLAEDSSRPLCGFAPLEVREGPGPHGEGEVGVTLARGDERLRLTVLPRAAGVPGALTSARHALTFAPETPLDTAEKRRVAAVVLRAVAPVRGRRPA